MTLKRAEEAALFVVDHPPQDGAPAEAYGRWAQLMFERLAAFMRRPEFPGVVLTRLDAAIQPEFFKAEDGMLIYAGPGVLGPQEGLYIRESGQWKKLAGT